jgi:hypothetical protein
VSAWAQCKTDGGEALIVSLHSVSKQSCCPTDIVEQKGGAVSKPQRTQRTPT